MKIFLLDRPGQPSLGQPSLGQPSLSALTVSPASLPIHPEYTTHWVSGREVKGIGFRFSGCCHTCRCT